MFGDSPAIMNMGALRILIIPLPLRDGRALDQNILIIIVPHTRTLLPFFTLGLRVVVAEPDEFPVPMHQPTSSHVHLVVAMRTFADNRATVCP